MKRVNQLRGPSSSTPHKSAPEFQVQLAEAQTEAQTVGILQSVLSSIQSQKASRSPATASPSSTSSGSIAALFCDPASNAPDLMFSLCRRYASCIPLISKILGALSDSPDFGRRALRVRTNLAFMRFIPVHPPLAEVFESLITSHSQAFRQFVVDGEKVLADVLSQLTDAPNISSLLSLLHITHKVVGETPSKTQDRLAVFNAIGMSISSVKIQDFLFASMADKRLMPSTPGAWVWDALEVVIGASFKHDVLVVPFEVACLLAISLIGILTTITNQSRLASSSYNPDTSGSQASIFNVLLQQKRNERVTKREHLSVSSRPKWDALLSRFLALLLTQDSPNRLSSPMTRKLAEAVEQAGHTVLSQELCTKALKVFGRWGLGGWIAPSVVDCCLIPFRRRRKQQDNQHNTSTDKSLEESSSIGSRDVSPVHTPLLSATSAQQASPSASTAEMQEIGAATTILIMCCGKPPEVTSRLKMVSPAVFELVIRHYFSESNLSGSASPRGENGEATISIRQLVALLICFIHVSVYLQLCPIEAFFLPLSTHINHKRISEKKFVDITRWQRNDQRDATIFDSIRQNMERMNVLNSEEHEKRHTIARQWKVGYQQTILAQHQPAIVLLMKDPTYIQARKDHDDCLRDDRKRLEEKMDIIQSHHAYIEGDRDTQLADISQKLEERLNKEKEVYHKETDDIVWDADEKAQKEQSHAAKLTAISKAGEVKYQELSHMFEWRMRVCRSAADSLAAYQAAKNNVTMASEKLEERERGRYPPVISSMSWVLSQGQNSVVGHEKQAWNHLHTETVEGRAVALHQVHRHEQLRQLHEARWQRGELEEEWERSSIELHCSFFSGIAGLGVRSQALRQQLQCISKSHDVLLSDWIGTNEPIDVEGFQVLSHDKRSSKFESFYSATEFFSPFAANRGSIATSDHFESIPRTTSILSVGSKHTSHDNVPVVTKIDSTALFGKYVEACEELIKREGQWRRYFLETFALQTFHITAAAAVFSVRSFHIQHTEALGRTVMAQHAAAAFDAAMVHVKNLTMGQKRNFRQQSSVSLSDAFEESYDDGSGQNTRYSSKHHSPLQPDQLLTFDTEPPFAPTVGRIVANRKIQKLDLFQLETHRRKRIESMFDVARFQMTSYLQSITIQRIMINPLFECETHARQLLVAKSVQDFTLLEKRMEWDLRFAVPLYRLIEVERQERGALETDEIIYLNRTLVFRPRGKRYRPPRNDDTPVKIPLEPAVTNRVRLWQRQIAHSNLPMFADIPHPDSHTPTTKEILFGMTTSIDPIKIGSSDTEVDESFSNPTDSPSASDMATSHSAVNVRASGGVLDVSAAVGAPPRMSPLPIEIDVDVLSGANSEDMIGDQSDDDFRVALPRPLNQNTPECVTIQPFVTKLRGEVTATQEKKNEKVLVLVNRLEYAGRLDIQRQEASKHYLLLSTYHRTLLERKALDIANSFSAAGDRGLARRRSTVAAPGWRSRADSSSGHSM